MSSGPNVPRAKRLNRSREFHVSRSLNKRLDELKDDGENLSAIAEEALRAHPKVMRDIVRMALADARQPAIALKEDLENLVRDAVRRGISINDGDESKQAIDLLNAAPMPEMEEER